MIQIHHKREKNIKNGKIFIVKKKKELIETKTLQLLQKTIFQVHRLETSPTHHKRTWKMIKSDTQKSNPTVQNLDQKSSHSKTITPTCNVKVLITADTCHDPKMIKLYLDEIKKYIYEQVYPLAFLISFLFLSLNQTLNPKSSKKLLLLYFENKIVETLT